MYKTVKLNQVVSGTVFTYKGVIWKKTGTGRGDAMECVPKYGGQWQERMAEFIENDTEVSIKAD